MAQPKNPSKSIFLPNPIPNPAPNPNTPAPFLEEPESFIAIFCPIYVPSEGKVDNVFVNVILSPILKHAPSLEKSLNTSVPILIDFYPPSNLNPLF